MVSPEYQVDNKHCTPTVIDAVKSECGLNSSLAFAPQKRDVNYTIYPISAHFTLSVRRWVTFEALEPCLERGLTCTSL